MSTNLPPHGPKWKSANHILECHNDEFRVIKRKGENVWKTNTDFGISI